MAERNMESFAVRLEDPSLGRSLRTSGNLSMLYSKTWAYEHLSNIAVIARPHGEDQRSDGASRHNGQLDAERPIRTIFGKIHAHLHEATRRTASLLEYFTRAQIAELYP